LTLGKIMKRVALISVSDKTGLESLAKELEKLGFEILSTGGTANFLKSSLRKRFFSPLYLSLPEKKL